jgi:branched-chain amino acid transport system substrate-binding protein
MKNMKTSRSISLFSPTLSLVVMTLVMGLTFHGLVSSAQAQEEFKYGAVMPVTGPIPQYGEFFIRGSQLALEDIEKSGWVNGKKIRIALEDGKNDPKLSLAAMNKLNSIDKVPIIETVGSPVLLSLGPVAQENGVVLVNTAAQNPLIRKLGSYIFSLVPLADQVMSVVVEHTVKGLKAKKVAITHVNTEFGRGTSEAFAKLYEQEGGKIVATEIYAIGETDFTTHLTKLKFVNADVIFFVGHENELGYFFKKAKQMGVKTQFLISPGIINPLTFQIAGDSAEGAQTGDYYFDPVSGSDRMQAFGKRHKDRFGILPTAFTANSYDCVMLYASALKAGHRTGAQIRDYFLSLKNYDGMAQPITFGKDGITLQGPIIRVVRGGKLVTMGK